MWAITKKMTILRMSKMRMMITKSVQLSDEQLKYRQDLELMKFTNLSLCFKIPFAINNENVHLGDLLIKILTVIPKNEAVAIYNKLPPQRLLAMINQLPAEIKKVFQDSVFSSSNDLNVPQLLMGLRQNILRHQLAREREKLPQKKKRRKTVERMEFSDSEDDENR
eukprot:UN00395